VNLAQGFVSFQQSETEDDEIKATKTGRNRKTPIEPTLLPLLTSMHEAAKGEGRVITTMPPREEWAARLRKYVRWALEDAGMAVREELLASDATRRQLNFHDLRHTGITWRAVRGDEPLKIQRAAGHTDLKTTQRYIEEAEVFDREAFGEVFPPLPARLAGATSRIGQEVGNWAAIATQALKMTHETQRPRGESLFGVRVLEYTKDRRALACIQTRPGFVDEVASPAGVEPALAT
jgi:hypothetical protein